MHSRAVAAIGHRACKYTLVAFSGAFRCLHPYGAFLGHAGAIGDKRVGKTVGDRQTQRVLAGAQARSFGQFMHLEEDDTITMVAMDGYEMTYSGSQIRDDADGDWILAFKSDGEYLPEDPGFIRTVKVGPKTPNIAGHLSVRMIEKIVVKEEGYRDFKLSINGKMNFTLDRQTIQQRNDLHIKHHLRGNRVGSRLLRTHRPRGVDCSEAVVDGCQVDELGPGSGR